MSELDKLMASMIGKSEAETKTVAWSKYFDCRTVMADGVPYVVTRDYRSDRLNLTLKAGLVVGVSVG